MPTYIAIDSLKWPYLDYVTTIFILDMKLYYCFLRKLHHFIGLNMISMYVFQKETQSIYYHDLLFIITGGRLL